MSELTYRDIEIALKQLKDKGLWTLMIWSKDGSIKEAIVDDPGVQHLAKFMRVTPEEWIESQIRAWRMMNSLYRDDECEFPK